MNSVRGNNSCTTLKPNTLAPSSVTEFSINEYCNSRRSSTVSSSLKTVFSTPTQHNNFKSNAFRTLSRAKFCISVLILLGAIAVRSSHATPVPTTGTRLILHTQQYRQQRHQQLLQQQRSLVLPTPHRHHLHHRSVRNMLQPGQTNEDENNGSDISDQCQILTTKLEKRIKDALGQANATFSHLYNSLKLYTAAQHNDTPENFYEQWKKHSLGLNHAYAKHLENIRGFNILPENIKADKIHLWNNPLTSATLQTEFENISQTLKSMEHIYEDVMKIRVLNREQVYHDLRRGNESSEATRERANTINEFFENVRKDLKQDIFHTGKIMEELDVPNKDNLVVTYNKNIQHLEWQLFQEHLAMMKYLVAMYTSILQKCVKE